MGGEDDAEVVLRGIYTVEERQRAQEIISAHLNQLQQIRDDLLSEYCVGEGLLGCFIDFFYASVVAEPEESGRQRFNFMQWMLGDILEHVADSSGRDPRDVALQLMNDDIPASFPSPLDLAVRAAQSTLVSHLEARDGQPTWGIEANLSREALSRLTAGVHVLVYVLCFDARGGLSEQDVIVALLPHLTAIPFR